MAVRYRNRRRSSMRREITGIFALNLALFSLSTVHFVSTINRTFLALYCAHTHLS